MNELKQLLFLLLAAPRILTEFECHCQSRMLNLEVYLSFIVYLLRLCYSDCPMTKAGEGVGGVRCTDFLSCGDCMLVTEIVYSESICFRTSGLYVKIMDINLSDFFFFAF